ncbi:N-acetyllactosaminide 3-alpha-galactosyltransferase [Teladorsagia circumcincta]|uniref:Beta-1,4-N-acetylgalactosaminyltransferase n=1 Tax=Teladorsagia circumcincta TaxID=45464 RepID=A0A2G9UPF6_TELCI|nr:N-acetyllactosaminide 3-alpha-galactosyltransferase [Teladorsagia circumcincta]
MHSFLTRQKLDYSIIVVEQIPNQTFNRAKLFNVGFVEANKIYEWDCYLFHDVDLLPEDDRNYHVCPTKNPRHMAVAVNKWEYKLLYRQMFGTSSALTQDQFNKTNGFSNRYWGWGGEDDDMYERFCLTDIAVVPEFYTGSDHRLLRASTSRCVLREQQSLGSEAPGQSLTKITSLVSVWEYSVIENIDEEYYGLVEHLHDNGRMAESLEVTKGRLSPETLELIRQRGAARAAGNHQLTSELAKLCREAIKKDFKERRAAVPAEAAKAGRSIRNARQSFASYKTKMTCLRRPDGTVTASRRAMEKVIHDFYSDLFDSHVHLPTYQLQQDGYVVP